MWKMGFMNQKIGLITGCMFYEPENRPDNWVYVVLLSVAVL